ncbi:hypothetical protein [Piscirickettsia salmonis]|uniref:hypothetical protein n=1 Tax=Piscirickettsia salmonis TaxID=1238 RepID=UPI001C54E042|nr:hypothetical protein [Piscirickettsia salmonis]
MYKHANIFNRNRLFNSAVSVATSVGIFAHPMMQNRRAKRNKYKPSDCPRHTALRALNRHTPLLCSHMTLRFV